MKDEAERIGEEGAEVVMDDRLPEVMTIPTVFPSFCAGILDSPGGL